MFFHGSETQSEGSSTSRGPRWATKHVFQSLDQHGCLKTTKGGPAGKLRLKKGDIAVTLHKAEFDGVSDSCFVESQPFTCPDAGNPVHILSGVGLRVDQAQQMLQWGRWGDRCQFTLPHFSSVSMAALLKQFVEAEAFEGKGHFLQANVLSRRALQELSHEGWALESEEGWQLTKAAASKLCVAQRVGDPKPPFGPDSEGAPLHDQSTWQLCMRLAPKSLPSPFAKGAPRIWYTSGVTVKKEYVLCLLQTDRILDLESDCLIHHGKALEYYKHLLAGNYQLALQFLEQRDQRRSQRSFDNAIPDSSAAPMIADEGIDWQVACSSKKENAAVEGAPLPSASRD